MEIPRSVIEKLNQATGIEGQAHQILIDGQWVDTGCMEWAKRPNPGKLWANISPALQDAIQRSQVYLQTDPSANPQARLDQFFAAEPPEIRDAYLQFTRQLEAAMSPPPPPALPPISPELQNVLDRMQETLSHENFEKANGMFDLEAYSARARALLEAEANPALLAEYASLGRQIQSFAKRANRSQQRTRLELKAVRALLAGEPVVVYRAGYEWQGAPSPFYDSLVVAPTTDPFDILRYEQTQADNYGLDTEGLIARLKEINSQFGIDITGAAWDGLEFELKRVPKGKEAQALGQRLLDLCPDLYEPPTRFPKGRVSLWWD